VQNPENTPAVEDAGSIGEETVFVETPEHAAERLGVEEELTARQEAMLRHPSRGSITNQDELQKLRTATGQLYTDQPSIAFHDQAIRAVQEEHRARQQLTPGVDDLFVVWFVKVLGNWKALVGQKSTTNYYEVTFNVATKDAYVDRYLKASNTVIHEGLLS
jgi:hypothetical protein